MKYSNLSSPEKWIIKGIPIIFIMGAITHFLFKLSGGNPIIGAVVAINESPWEHLKMVLIPTIGWYILYYIVKGKMHNLDKNKWFAAGLFSLRASMASIILLFYFYTGAFGVDFLVVDILIFLLSVVIGQLLAFHFYKYGKGLNSNLVIGLFIFIIAIFFLFTFNAPRIPLFRDSVTGTYGIQ